MTAAKVLWRPTSSLKFPDLVDAQPSVERLHCYLTADFYIELSIEYFYVELLFGFTMYVIGKPSGLLWWEKLCEDESFCLISVLVY